MILVAKSEDGLDDVTFASNVLRVEFKSFVDI